MTYVDVGAFRGEVLRAAIESGLVVNEAHLIEPNPVSFEGLESRVREYYIGGSLNAYNIALGASSGSVTIRPARSMTKVIASDQGDGHIEEGVASNNQVQVECRTLDEVSENLTEKHVSLLKIDVEGAELDVISGADELLGNQLVDVIYIEAGMNPEGRQQTYYRDIEDKLTSYGYRLFRIYEQMHEWMDDSPVLRRVNMAFMSTRFSDKHPYKVTNELFEAQNKLAETAKTHERLESSLKSASDKSKELSEKLIASGNEIRDLKGQIGRLEQELRDLAEFGLELEKHMNQLLSSRSWRLMTPARVLGRMIRRLLLRRSASTSLPRRPKAMVKALEEISELDSHHRK